MQLSILRVESASFACLHHDQFALAAGMPFAAKSMVVKLHSGNVGTVPYAERPFGQSLTLEGTLPLKAHLCTMTIYLDV